MLVATRNLFLHSLFQKIEFAYCAILQELRHLEDGILILLVGPFERLGHSLFNFFEKLFLLAHRIDRPNCLQTTIMKMNHGRTNGKVFVTNQRQL